MGILLASVLMIAIVPAWGADFSTYTTGELAAMRGTLRDAAPEERTAFREEWQKRIQSMTAEERQQYMGRPANARADGSGYRTNGSGRRYSAQQQAGNGGGRHGRRKGWQ